MGIFGLVLGLYEATAFTFSNGLFAVVLPIIPILVVLIMREHTEEALVISAVAGIVLDIFATEAPTFATARFLLITLAAAFVARSVLTNNSLYAAVAMTVAARCIDRLWILLMSWMHGWMPLRELARVTWPSFWRTGLADICIVVAAFFVLTFLIKRFVMGKLQDRRYV